MLRGGYLEPEGAEILEEFAHAIRVAYVYVEGGCELIGVADPGSGSG